MTDSPFHADISNRIWEMKYRFASPDGGPVDKTVAETWQRVAKAVAKAETGADSDTALWESKFFNALKDFRFLPAGRILAGAGTARDVTLFNCFVMGTIPDSMDGIFSHLREAALTLQQGGGIGYDFSTLRPKGYLVKGVGADASGPVSFMDVWDSMCRTIMSAGSRRGAMMATLRCDHPDIEEFITAKQTPGRLTNFNLSVLASDAFMTAVKAGDGWDLVFDGKIARRVEARDLWNKIMRSTYDYAEPGVIFIDRINQRNNLHYCETIAATNPCGEQPLPPYGACLLGSINLSALVEASFTPSAAIDMTALRDTVTTAVRLMDNVIDVSRFPLEEQKQEALAKRRIGLGVTGLADAFIQCGVRYGSPESLELAAGWFDCLRDAAYRASIELAAEKGPFPLFDADAYLAGETIRELDPAVQALIRQHGIRNALLTSIAPTGTISLLANNVSSGIEPVFAFTHDRRVLLPNGETTTETVENNAHRLYRLLKGDAAPLTDAFVDAQSLSPKDHLAVQALVQKYIDSSISKTINLPETIGFDDFQSIYFDAYDQGCKGCTTYRPSDIRGAVLSLTQAEPEAPAAAVPVKAAPAGEPKTTDKNAIVYMTQPLDRPPALTGSTYKINWPESDHAIYITVNDITQDGRRRPFEVFINSKNMEHYAWTVALTRMISAVFRRGGDVVFVVEELKAVFDPRGGYWMRGHYVPSLLAAIGEVIENHMIETGFIDRMNKSGGDTDTVEPPLKRQAVAGAGRQCPRCGTAGLIKQEGCDTCTGCGWSRCG